MLTAPDTLRVGGRAAVSYSLLVDGTLSDLPVALRVLELERAAVANGNQVVAKDTGIVHLIAEFQNPESGDVLASDTVRILILVGRVTLSVDSIMVREAGRVVIISARVSDLSGVRTYDSLPVVSWFLTDTNAVRVLGTTEKGRALLVESKPGVHPATCVVASVQGVADTAVVVVAQVVTAVAVNPDSLRLSALGDTVALGAVARDAGGSVVTGAVVTWTAGDTLVARVSAQGKVTAVGAGATVVIGAVGPVADTAVVVVDQVPARIAFSPPALTVTAIGDTVRIVAAVVDRLGSPIPGATASFVRTSDTGVVVLLDGELAASVGRGEAYLVAEGAGLRDSALVRVDVLTGATCDSDGGARRSGLLKGAVRWTAEDSPHRVYGVMTTVPGASLTIEAGALVCFDIFSGLEIGDSADLHVLGTATSPVTLTAFHEGYRWEGVRLTGVGAPAEIRHARIKWAGFAEGVGARPVIEASGAHPIKLSHAEITDFLATSGSVGVLLTAPGSSLDSSTVDGRGRLFQDAGSVVRIGGDVLFRESIVRGSTSIGLELERNAVLDGGSIEEFSGIGLSIASDSIALVNPPVILGDGCPMAIPPAILARWQTIDSRLTTVRQGVCTAIVLNGGLLAHADLSLFPQWNWKLTGDLTIGSGGRVEIEAGTHADGGRIVITEGHLSALGTTTLPVGLFGTRIEYARVAPHTDSLSHIRLEMAGGTFGSPAIYASQFSVLAIDSSTIDGGAGRGIVALGPGSSIRHTGVRGVNTDGITIADSGSVEEVLVDQVGGRGLVLIGRGVVLRGVTVRGAAGVGIDVASGSLSSVDSVSAVDGQSAPFFGAVADFARGWPDSARQSLLAGNAVAAVWLDPASVREGDEGSALRGVALSVGGGLSWRIRYLRVLAGAELHLLPLATIVMDPGVGGAIRFDSGGRLVSLATKGAPARIEGGDWGGVVLDGAPSTPSVLDHLSIVGAGGYFSVYAVPRPTALYAGRNHPFVADGLEILGSQQTAAYILASQTHIAHGFVAGTEGRNLQTFPAVLLDGAINFDSSSIVGSARHALEASGTGLHIRALVVDGGTGPAVRLAGDSIQLEGATIRNVNGVALAISGRVAPGSFIDTLSGTGPSPRLRGSFETLARLLSRFTKAEELGEAPAFVSLVDTGTVGSGTLDLPGDGFEYQLAEDRYGYPNAPGVLSGPIRLHIRRGGVVRGLGPDSRLSLRSGAYLDQAGAGGLVTFTAADTLSGWGGLELKEGAISSTRLSGAVVEWAGRGRGGIAVDVAHVASIDSLEIRNVAGIALRIATPGSTIGALAIRNCAQALALYGSLDSIGALELTDCRSAGGMSLTNLGSYLANNAFAQLRNPLIAPGVLSGRELRLMAGDTLFVQAYEPLVFTNGARVVLGPGAVIHSALPDSFSQRALQFMNGASIAAAGTVTQPVIIHGEALHLQGVPFGSSVLEHVRMERGVGQRYSLQQDDGHQLQMNDVVIARSYWAAAKLGAGAAINGLTVEEPMYGVPSAGPDAPQYSARFAVDVAGGVKVVNLSIRTTSGGGVHFANGGGCVRNLSLAEVSGSTFTRTSSAPMCIVGLSVDGVRKGSILNAAALVKSANSPAAQDSMFAGSGVGDSIFILGDSLSLDESLGWELTALGGVIGSGTVALSSNFSWGLEGYVSIAGGARLQAGPGTHLAMGPNAVLAVDPSGHLDLLGTPENGISLSRRNTTTPGYAIVFGDSVEADTGLAGRFSFVVMRGAEQARHLDSSVAAGMVVGRGRSLVVTQSRMVASYSRAVTWSASTDSLDLTIDSTRVGPLEPAVQLGPGIRVDGLRVRWSLGVGLQTSAGDTVTDCTILANAGRGVDGRLGDLQLRRCQVLANGMEGVLVAGGLGVNVAIAGTVFEGNAGAGVRNIGNIAVSAVANWWGGAEGPTGAGGDGVEGLVLFEPWLVAPP